ncbi:uncharacterized protein si:dkey-79d12.4 isoform X3 [Silurus meridionalis]|nr:uncharacterized protein si:dkey-79d12.4 isoform X3 [Silurus meridionalis]
MRLVVLSEEEKRSVLTECHNNPDTGNHSGIRGTQNRVTAGYYWPTIIQDVKDWVRSCHRCQLNDPIKSCVPDLHSIKLWSAVAMEISCKETKCAVNAERWRDKDSEDERNKVCGLTKWEETQCSMTRTGLKQEPEEVALGGFSDGKCCMCGGHTDFLEHRTEHFINHKHEPCCHLCQAKFSHRNSLIMHMQNAHPYYYTSCKSCGMYTDTTRTPDTNPLPEEVEEVIIKNEEVEINCIKEEEEEGMVFGTIEQTEENGFAETPEDNKMIPGNLHDHTYFCTQTCNSAKETPNNIVMYTSNENVLVFVNKTNNGISPTRSYTEHDQQGTPVNDQTVCRDIHDHNYFFNPSLANHDNMHMSYETTDTDLERTESDQDSIQEHDLLCTGLLDHTYFSRQSLENHTVLLKQEPSPSTCSSSGHEEPEDPDQRNIDTMTGYGATLLESQLELNVKVEDEDSEIETIQEDVVIQRPDHEDSDSLLTGNEDSSEPCSAVFLDSTSKSWSVCPQQIGQINKQKPLRSFDSVNSTRDQTTSFPCSLCKIVFGTKEMLVNHKAQKHPLAKYMCVMCRKLFPNQNIYIQHICNMTKGCTEESPTPSNRSNNPKRSLLLIPNPVSSSVDVESSKQVSINRTVSHLTSSLLPKCSLSSDTQKVRLHAMTTRSSSAQQKKAVLNGDQGQMTTPISAVTQKQIVQVLLSNQLQGKGVPQTPPSSGTRNSTVTQTVRERIQDLTLQKSKVVANTPTGSAELMPSVALPLQHQSYEVHLESTHFAQVVSSVSNSVQVTGQLPESTVSRSPLLPEIFPSSQGPVKIVGMFVNQSKELALQKRMRQSWRSKAVFPCRQCGAVSRQFSLIVRHRYQHRGPRLHRCQCGRAFRQLMHLLRHQVQHAEATRYVCAACGQMFCGTQQLACHRPLFRITASMSEKQANQKCRNVFQCHCGRRFMRPAALLWHMLKNSYAHKPRLKGFRLN